MLGYRCSSDPVFSHSSRPQPLRQVIWRKHSCLLLDIHLRPPQWVDAFTDTFLPKSILGLPQSLRPEENPSREVLSDHIKSYVSIHVTFTESRISNNSYRHPKS